MINQGELKKTQSMATTEYLRYLGIVQPCLHGPWILFTFISLLSYLHVMLPVTALWN